MTSDDFSSDDDIRELIRALMNSGSGGVDPELLSRLANLQLGPAEMQNVVQQLQQAFVGEAPPWETARRQALHIANQDGQGVSEGQRVDTDQAFTLATLWLSEATTVTPLATPPRAITRGDWVEATIPVWKELAEPVATSVADALTEALQAQTPDDMQAVVASAGQLMRTMGGSLFAAQLGHVIGGLAKEVISGGDVGIPLMPTGEAAVLPQNFADFGSGLEIPADQLALYLTTRELAHARLFRHSRWLRLLVLTHVTGFARGIHVDTSALEDLAGRFDPENPEELQAALRSGALLPARSEEQTAALAQLEHVLATIEGWVDVVTEDATGRLPSASKVAEAVRRRRAVGGPGERALTSLVGLELRPRRMREAAAMWRAITAAVGVAGRDALWDYPDLMPTAADIDDPTALVARLEALARGDAPARDDVDEAIERLLSSDDPGQAN